MILPRGMVACLVLLGFSACAGPMKRLGEGLSGDAGTIVYSAPLKSCPPSNAELPAHMKTDNYHVEAGRFTSSIVFVKDMPYCHGYTKYTFKEISAEDDEFHVFSAYARVDRGGGKCTFELAALAEIECRTSDLSECQTVREQEHYVDEFFALMEKYPGLEFDDGRRVVRVFEDMGQWQEWCHKRIRVKTYR